MDEKQQENSLDQQLREAAPYIDDEGFTARVLQQLPPPRRGRDSLRAVILLGITLLASALAYVLSDGGRFLVVAMARLAAASSLWPVASLSHSPRQANRDLRSHKVRAPAEHRVRSAGQALPGCRTFVPA